MSINSLPDEILRQIFFQLPIEERLFYASSVCKRWKYLMPYEDFNEIHIEEFHDRICRSSSWCNLHLAGKDKQLVKLWLKNFLKCILPVYGYYMKTIDFNFVQHNLHRLLIDDEILQIVYQNCPNTIGLNLLNCDLSLNSLSVLTKFSMLRKLSVVDDWKFEIANIWKNLNLTHFDSHMSRPFGNVTRPEDLISIKTDIGSNFFLNLNIFCSQYSNVQELCIKNCRWVSPENFSLISMLNKLKVLHLELQDDLLHSDEINEICQGCRLIENLSISYLQPNIGDNLNLASLKLLLNLEKLYFNVEYIYGAQLAIIANMKRLKHLEIFCTKFCSLENFDDDASKQWPDLESLAIFCKNSTETSFETDDDSCSLLYSLFLKNSKFLKSAGVIVESFNQTANIRSIVLNEYLQTCSAFNHLTDGHVWFEDTKKLDTFFRQNFLVNMKKLTINGKATLSHNAAFDISVCCPNLERLIVCKSVEHSVEVVISLLKFCRTLKHFNASSKLMHLPTEELMYAIGAHRCLKKFEYHNLLPAYHLSHFKNVIFGRQQLINDGYQSHPIYIEAVGTFYLPGDVLKDLKCLLICFTNVYLIETKFRCSQ